MAVKHKYAAPHRTPSQGDRLPPPAVTRATPEAQMLAIPMSITRIDEANRLVTLRATSEATDTFKTAFAYEASKAAFQAWEQIGNIREMHQGKAVGRAAHVDYLDDQRAIDVTLRVSKGAPDTWEKIKDGTLQGGSIGASNVVWTVNQNRAANAPEKIATKYDLIELSLVDSPSNPECRVTCVRSAQPDMTILDYQEDATVSDVSPRPKGLLADGVATNVNPAIANAMADAYGASVAAQDTRAAAPVPYQVTAQGVTLPPPAESPAQPVVPMVGIPAPDNTLSITEMRRQMATRRSDVAERGQFIAAAGDAAVREARLPVPGPGHNYADYVTAVAEVRARGEMDAITAWEAETQRKALHPDVAAHAQLHHTDQTEATTFAPAAVPADLPVATFAATLDAQSAPSQPVAEADRVVEEEHTHADGVTHTHKVRVHQRGAQADHSHAYLDGQPVDASLLTPEFFRGTPWQIDAIADQGKLLKANPPEAGSLTTMATITAPVVGHPVMYNTEDAEALGFAVPAAATGIRPTPTDNLTLDPAMFHPGGHTPAFDNLAGAMDQDGDYDRDEDAREATLGDVQVGTPLPAFTAIDYDAVEPTPLGRTAEADTTRVGARISADGMDQLHEVREQAAGALRSVCEHCGCPTCKVLILALDGNAADDDDDDDEDDAEDLGEDEERLAYADLARATAATNANMAILAQGVADMADYLARQDPQAIQRMLRDITLTVADQQRGLTAQVTRGMQDQTQQMVSTLNSSVQQLTALAETVSGVAATVARIEAQPLPQAGPVTRAQYPNDPRLAPPPSYTTYASVPENLLADITRAAATLTPQQQAEIAAKYIQRG